MQWLLYYFLIYMFGLALGSFMNSWVWRTRENLRISTTRSICPHCRIKLAWYDNIPVISFVVLRAKCRKCEAKISWQYPIVEFFTGIAFVAVAGLHNIGFASPQITGELVRDLLIIFFLTFIFIYDLKFQEIYNFSTILPGIVLFFLSLGFGWRTWQSMVLGIMFGAGFFLFLYIISKGRWIGGGDISLGFFMGVILGWPCILIAFLISYITGAVVSLLLISMKKKTMKSEIAFGTFLVFGTVIAMFWCEQITHWYFGLL